MEYPGTWLTKPIRTAILIFFITAFFVISPLVLLYTAGYRYDFKNGLIKETGAISIDIEPKNAHTFINEEYFDKMPIRLKNVTPNKYDVKIELDGYYTWKKEIEVEKRETVYIKDISLLQNNEPQLLLEKDPYLFEIIQDSFLIYCLKTEDIHEVWSRNLKNNNDQLLLRLTSPDNLTITPAKNFDYIVVSNDDNSILTIINLDEPEKQIQLNKKIEEPITKFEWNDNNDPELFFSTQTKIMSIKPVTENIYQIADNQYMDWSMENGHLWTLQLNTTTNYIEIFEDTLGFSKQINKLEIKGKQIFSIINKHNNNILIKNISQPEMFLINEKNTFKISGDKSIISDANNWWLMWSWWELQSYVEDDEPLLLNRSGEKLQEVIPLDRYNTLALVWADKTTILYPYYFVNFDLTDYSIKNVKVDTQNKILYFLINQPDKNGVWLLKY